jgi:hypothetical protein
VLFKCEFSTQALQAAGLEQYIVPCNQPCRSIHGSIQEICSSLDKKPTGLFAMLAWVLWNNSNNSVWNGMKEPRRNLAIKARPLWEEWSSVQQVQQGLHNSEQQ